MKVGLVESRSGYIDDEEWIHHLSFESTYRVAKKSEYIMFVGNIETLMGLENWASVEEHVL